jgi:hypothetical protein
MGLCALLKSKGQPITDHEGPERYSSIPSLISALYGDRWLMSCPSHFTHRKQRQYQFYKRLGGPQGQSGQILEVTANN